MSDKGSERDLVTLDVNETVVDAVSENGIYVEGDGIRYTTGKIAEMLHANRDIVRRTIHDFEEMLDVDYTKPGRGGHMRLAAKDIERLDNIMRLRKTRSVDEVKRILADPALFGLFDTRNQESISEMVMANNRYLLAELSKVIARTYKESATPLLEDVDAVTKENLSLKEEMAEQTAALKEEISQLKDQSEKQTQLIQELYDQLQEKNEEPRGLMRLFRKNR